MTPQRAVSLIDSAAQYAMVFDYTDMQAHHTLNGLILDIMSAYPGETSYDSEKSESNLEKWQHIRELRRLVERRAA